MTRAGSLLLVRAEALLAEFGRIAPAVRAAEDTVTGHVTLGVPPTAGLMIAPAVFRAFREQWPAATLQIREGISSFLEEWLLDGRLDVAVLHNPPPLAGVDIAQVIQERMVVVHAGGGEARAPIRFRDVGTIPLILPSMPHSNRRLVERAALQHGTRLHVVIEVDSIPLTKAMVAGGFGATLLTRAGVSKEVAADELSAQPIDNPPLLSTVAIASVSADRPRWLVGALAELVTDEVTHLVHRGAWPGARLVSADPKA